MKWSNLAQAGSYAFIAREGFNIVTRRRSRLRDLQRSKNISMVLGISLGAVAGIATGFLMAPKTGRDTRHTIASQTREIMDTLRHNAREAREDLEEKGSRAGTYTRESAAGVREAVRESQR